MYIYDTVLKALEDLRKRGFTSDINLEGTLLKASDHPELLHPENFEIVEHYRFEGETDPGDETIVLAVTSKDGKTKGVLINAYGAYSDEFIDELMQKMKVEE